MGNQIDKKAQFDGGYLYVRTDKPYYESGEVCKGKVFIRAEKALNAKTISIKINGKEQASFYYMDLSDPYFEQNQDIKRKI